MKRQIILFCLLTLITMSLSARQKPTERHRIIISSDIGGTDPDDNQSMAHLLMYSDELELEGLISSPSFGSGSAKEIYRMIDVYAQDLPVLSQHINGLMTPEQLRPLVKQGRTDALPPCGYGEPTEGSQWIVTQARKDDPRPLYVLVWGCLEDVAQALHDAPDIAPKLRVYWIAGPNKKWGVNGYCYIIENFPDLWMIENNTTYRSFIYDPKNNDQYNMGFFETYIKGSGNLGRDFAAYYKGNPKLGDTPSLLYMMDGDPTQPEQQSWGGRFVRCSSTPRSVYHGATTAHDTTQICGIIEWQLQGPVRNDIAIDSACITLDIRKQKWAGYYKGNGLYVVRHSTYYTGTLDYTITSTVEGFAPINGQITVANTWHKAPCDTDYRVGAHWWTDSYDPQDYWQDHAGARYQHIVRDEIMQDWGNRWLLLRQHASCNTLFDDDWRFRRGDEEAFASSAYDDSQWRRLALPHDWSIECDFDSLAPAAGDGGYLPCGTAWYRKTFTAPTLANNRQLLLYFEGVYMNSSVYVNGTLAGGHPYGYSSFWVDVTGLVEPGKANTIAVRVDNAQQRNCRWYSGSGIYRHVWLVERDKEGISDPWKLYLRAEQFYGISADGSKADSVTLRISYEGRPDEVRTFRNVSLWSPEHPVLYNIAVGELQVEYGFRKAEFSVNDGFVLNGIPVKLNGGCLHHDNGIIGAAAFDKAEWRKAELLKDAGFNAARTSHNAPSPEFLRACDHLGLLVIDEAFDGWRDAKNGCDYHLLLDEWWQRDIDALVLRDRNHPCIICWSNGNEIIERKKPEAVTTSAMFAQRMRQLDPSRPVTQALAAWDKDWDIYDPLAATLDIAGYNYLMHKVTGDHERVPSRIMWQTESYPRDAYSNWASVDTLPYVVGDFVWTAIDYIGESSIGTWHYEGENRGEHYQGKHFPWHGAYCGDIDVTGWRKPISHYRDMLWNDGSHERLFMAVKEPQGYHGEISETLWSVWPTWLSWNWPGWEGKDIDVDIYSRYPSVRLYLDDELIAERQTSRTEQYRAVIPVAYHAGTLRAVGVNTDGSEGEACVIRTAGKATQMRVQLSAESMKADVQDILYVTVEMLDDQGNIVPEADDELTFTVSGGAALLAAGSANMRDCTPYVSSKRHAWKGRAIAVLRATGVAQDVTLLIEAPGIKEQHITISCR